MKAPVTPVRTLRVEQGALADHDDLLVTEEPLEIRVGHGPLDDRHEFRLSVTMRTPGHDEELTIGFLLTEGLITGRSQLLRVAPCRHVRPDEEGNVVRAELQPTVELDPLRWQRNFYTTSSCGVCGKSSLQAIQVQRTGPLAPTAPLDHAELMRFPARMRAAQTVFEHTGGIHAAALFDRSGELVLLREDVGRHNAVDKVIGAVITEALDVAGSTLLVSGRAGFELVQKCVMARIPTMASVGAPSSLAVELAKESGLRLIGFLRGERFNIYAESSGSMWGEQPGPHA